MYLFFVLSFKYNNFNIWFATYFPRKTPLRLAVNDSLGLRPFGGLSAFYTSISGPALQGAPDETRPVFGAQGSEKLAARRRGGRPVLPKLPERHEEVCGTQRRVSCIFVSG